MSRFERTSEGDSGLPARLRAGAGTSLERRVLDAAAREEPSRELCERMALAIGVAPPPLDSVDPGASEAIKLSPKVGASSRALLTWLSGGVVVAVAATILATRFGAQAPVQPVSAPVLSASGLPPVPAPSSSLGIALPLQAPAAPTSERPPVVAGSLPLSRSRLSAPKADIQEQIALIDAARAALVSDANNRALLLVRQYQRKYPEGSFRPEAAALKIEALAKLGRSAEARALSEQFTAEYGDGPLADRVSRFGGRTRP